MLEGKNVNLRVVEKEDLALIAEWTAYPDFVGEYNSFWQKSKAEWQKRYDNLLAEEKWFFVEKKDGTKVGFIQHFPAEHSQEVGYLLVPSERGKGYCSEAAELMVDYLFLSKDTVRIQAHTNVRNAASQKVLEKIGFKKEGVVRKSDFVKGEWTDLILYSILREEWKEPKILTKKPPV